MKRSQIAQFDPQQSNHQGKLCFVFKLDLNILPISAAGLKLSLQSYLPWTNSLRFTADNFLLPRTISIGISLQSSDQLNNFLHPGSISKVTSRVLYT